MSTLDLRIVQQGGGSRSQLEFWASLLGYRPEFDDTDADLRIAILVRQ